MNVRGAPRELLDRLDARARAGGRTRNAELLDIVAAYAAGALAPTGQPPPFDPARPRAAPHGPETASLAISGIPADVWAGFRARAKAEGWLSKDDLIVGLLRKTLDLFP